MCAVGDCNKDNDDNESVLPRFDFFFRQTVMWMYAFEYYIEDYIWKEQWSLESIPYLSFLRGL